MRRDNKANPGGAVNAIVPVSAHRVSFMRFASIPDKKGPGGFLQPGQGRRKAVRRGFAAADFRR
jgi:hypothetical protein